MKTPRLYDLVVLNHLPDATLWRVVELDGKFNVGLRDTTYENSGRNIAIQWTDKSLLLPPTRAQLAAHNNRSDKQ